MDGEQGHRQRGIGPAGATDRGQATIESAALAALLALILIAVIAAIAGGGEVKAGRELAGGDRPSHRLRPAPPRRLPPPGGRPRLRLAAARLARVLAPVPEALPAADGLPLVRSTSAAAAVRAAPSRRPPPDRLQPPHHRLHPAARPPWLRRHRRTGLLGVPTDARVEGRPPHRHRGRRRSRRRHRGPRVPGPRPRPARDPPRPQSLRLPRRRSPAVAVAGRSALPRLVGLTAPLPYPHREKIPLSEKRSTAPIFVLPWSRNRRYATERLHAERAAARAVEISCSMRHQVSTGRPPRGA